MTTFYGSSFYSFFFSVEDAETDAATEETVVAMMDADVSLMKKCTYWKGGNVMPENRGCGCGCGFGGDCCWIIILFILIICCCGNNNGCC